MTSRPMSAARRGEIEQKIAIVDFFNDKSVHPVALDFIRELLMDSAYWRNAVRTQDPMRECTHGARYECRWCGALTPDDDSGNDVVPHRPDCAWVAAQS